MGLEAATVQLCAVCGQSGPFLGNFRGNPRKLCGLPFGCAVSPRPESPGNCPKIPLGTKTFPD